MPGLAVCLRRIFKFIVLSVILYLAWIFLVDRTPEGQGNNNKTSIKPRREDLKAEFVYRGSSDPVNLSDIGLVRNNQEKDEIDTGYRDFAYNVLVSRRLGPFRELPDTRHKTCLPKEYSTDLPTASVIICFFNEHTHTLARTVESVLKRSPESALRQVILVDDGSTNDVSPIKEMLTKESWAKVRLVETGGREGLIRARILGARHATGDALVFLDSHVECNVMWLEPLLQRIRDSSSNVAVPIIDSIDPDTLNYKPSPLVRGGMTWGLNFKWEQMQKEYFDTPGRFSSPILSPTMAGGLFAIDRKYFKLIGEYDRGLEIWGGENIELSLRIWMCGGKLEIIPCSRVGHIFRKRRPYSSTNQRGEDTQVLNVARVARVWLEDDYLKYFYETLPEAKHLDVGDISDRLLLKSRLGCKDFKWFHKTVYPQLLLPGEKLEEHKKVKFEAWDQKKRNFTSSFQLVEVTSKLCAQPTLGDKYKGGDLSLVSCLRTKGQTVFVTPTFQVLPGGFLCLDAQKNLRMQKCTEMEGPQRWALLGGESMKSPGRIYSEATGLCVGTKGGRLTTVICDEAKTNIWYFKQS